MSMIQLVCIAILFIVFLSANIAYIVAVKREGDEQMVPTLLFAFVLIMDVVALLMLILGAAGGLG